MLGGREQNPVHGCPFAEIQPGWARRKERLSVNSSRDSQGNPPFSCTIKRWMYEVLRGGWATVSKKSLLWVLGLGPGPQIGAILLFTILNMEVSVSASRMAK